MHVRLQSLIRGQRGLYFVNTIRRYIIRGTLHRYRPWCVEVDENYERLCSHIWFKIYYLYMQERVQVVSFFFNYNTLHGINNMKIMLGFFDVEYI